MRALIVNADDLGFSEAVDEGIVRAHREGVVTSTTLMTDGPSASSAVERVLREAPGIGLGLHVDLTGVRPGGALAVVRALGHVTGAEIEAVCEAQVARFRALVGRAPDHLDCHQHLAQFHPVTFAAYLAVARRCGVPVRSPAPFLAVAALRAFVERVERENGVPLGDALGPLGELADELARVWAASGVRAPSAFVHGFYGSAATGAGLREILRAAGEGVTEMMCHPGEDDARRGELAVLTDPAARAAVAACGVRLVDFRDV